MPTNALPATYTAFTPGSRIAFTPATRGDQRPRTGTIVATTPRYLHVECDYGAPTRCMRLTRAQFHLRRAKILLGEDPNPLATVEENTISALTHHPDLTGPATARLLRRLHSTSSLGNLTQSRANAHALYAHLLSMFASPDPGAERAATHYTLHLGAALPTPTRAAVFRHLPCA